MLQTSAVREWCADALVALGDAREEIDALNVFPVPDGDTGTNLFLTFEAAVEELEAVGVGAEDVAGGLRALVHGALLGARGNSGVILSQLARGAVEALLAADGSTRSAADGLRTALTAAADAAYAAVATPVEGTILTVARAAADAAAAADSTELATVVRATARGAHDALERTPDLLEPLRLAGVVDAGGRGLTVLLDVLLATVTGEHPPTARAPVPQPVRATEPSVDGPAYEVMYLLAAPDEALAVLKADLAGLGDSLLVVGGDGLWNVHVHVDDAGAAVEAGVRAGRPYRIRVTHLIDQAARRVPGQAAGGRVVIAMLPPGGLAAVAVDCGATVVASRTGQRPATRDLVDAIQAAHAGEVVVLPNARDTHAVAEAAAEWVRNGGLRVSVVPTRASVQVLAALAVHDAGRRFDDDVVSMTAAARATRSGAVTVAVREALTSAGVCRPGDVLGVIDEDIVLIGSTVLEVAEGLLERMLQGGGELVTLVLGADGEVDGRAVAARLRRTHPEIELAVHDGGQELFPLLIGVE